MLHTDARLLTVHEVAARLRLSDYTIRRRIHRGELRAVRVGTGPRAPLRIPEDAVHDLVNASPSGGEDAAGSWTAANRSRGQAPATAQQHQRERVGPTPPEPAALPLVANPTKGP